MSNIRPTNNSYGNYSGSNNYYYGGYGYGYGYGASGGGGSGEGAPARSLRDYLMILRERIWLFAVVFFIIFTGTLLYTLHAPKIFTAVSTVRLLRDDPDVLKAGGSIEDNTIRSMEDFNTEMNVLQSTTLVRQVASRLRGDELAAFMAPYTDMIRFTGPQTPAEVLMDNRRIVPIRMSLVAQIQYSHPNSEIAARVANLFAEEYVNHNLRQNIDSTIEAVESLQVHVESQREKVEALEMQLAEYRERYGSVSLDERADIDHQELNAIKRITVEDKRVLDEAETRWNLVQNHLAEGKPLWELPFIVSAPRVPELLSQVSQLRISEATLAKRYRDKHPRMIELRQSLEKAENELRDALATAVQKTRLELDQARRNFEQTSARLAEKEKEILELDRLRVEYDSIRRELQVARGLHEHMEMRRNTQMAEVTLKGASARVIDEAQPPRTPSSPRWVLNLAVGFAGGILAGLALVFAFALLDDRVKSAFDIETVIGLPLIGIVPRIKRLNSPEKAKAVASNIDRRVTEAFRAIHSTLKIGDLSKDAKVLLVTSTTPSEGKSFVTTNLSLTYAIHGQRTLLIDADLRMPSVGKSLSLDDSKDGVVSHFENGQSLDECIRREVYPNLDVLCAGGRAKNPTQILSDPKFEQMIQGLRDSYDRIIIDTPPVAAVSDALNILSLVDGVIFVIKFNDVKRRTVKSNLRRVVEANVPVFGAVLNQISITAASYYYTDYYNSSYSQYFEAPDSPAERSGDKTAVVKPVKGPSSDIPVGDKGD